MDVKGAADGRASAPHRYLHARLLRKHFHIAKARDHLTIDSQQQVTALQLLRGIAAAGHPRDCQHLTLVTARCRQPFQPRHGYAVTPRPGKRQSTKFDIERAQWRSANGLHLI